MPHTHKDISSLASIGAATAEIPRMAMTSAINLSFSIVLYLFNTKYILTQYQMPL
ncbi:MAG: hypothetical protein GYA24_19250 [Candidatus Lokiarchaeota archaeon]|nr:hypothetical protein [Candidatus Lokiarchaeota archaeon]